MRRGLVDGVVELGALAGSSEVDLRAVGWGLLLGWVDGGVRFPGLVEFLSRAGCVFTLTPLRRASHHKYRITAAFSNSQLSHSITHNP